MDAAYDQNANLPPAPMPLAPPSSHGIAHQMALAPPPGVGNGASDFWDVGDQSFIGQQLPPDHEFSQLVTVETDKSRTKPLVYLLLILVLAATGWGAYEYFVEERNPLDTVVAWINELMGEEPVQDEGPMPARKTKRAPRLVAVKSGSTWLKPVAGNPYWALPNAILGPKKDLGRLWSPEEEETFRAGLTHRYTYQRYKTVQDVRKMRLRGSDVILWDALQDKKLWTRGFAVVGLAEFNVEVSLPSLEGALAKARSELVANFFERFTRHPSAAQAFILRQAVKVLDERGRLVALHGIARSKDPLRDVYLVAATQDPGKHVKSWVRQAFLERPMNPDRYNDLLAVVQGKAPADQVVRLAKGMKAGKPAPASGKLTAAGDVATEDDLDEQQLEKGFEDNAAGGDVEFYETSGSLKDDGAKTDPETFEYQE